MSNRAAIIVFSIVLSLGLIVFVAIPVIFFQRVEEPDEEPEMLRPVADEGVFRSDDGGATWEQKPWVEGSNKNISSYRVNRILPHPTDSGSILLATEAHGLWISESRGDLWAPLSDATLPQDANVLSVAVNPSRRTEFYVAAFIGNRGRVYRTENDGRTFDEVYMTPVERFGVFDLHYHGGLRTIDIVTGQGGYLESVDSGAKWRVIRWFADGLIELLVHPLDASVRYVVTPRGSLFRTTDRGETWADMTPNFQQFPGATLRQRWVIDSRGTLYMGSQYGLLRSRDNGRTFEAVPILIPPEALPILAVAVAPSDPNRILISAANQVYASSDGGETWSIIYSPSGKRIVHLLIDRENPRTIYAVAAP